MITNKKVAFFHGLGIIPMSERKVVTKDMQYFLGKNLYYPFINYEREWYKDKCRSMFIIHSYACRDIDVIVGHSLGGYMAFMVANHLKKPCVLINPALDRKFTKLNIKSFDYNVTFTNPGIEIFLGELDDLIPMDVTIDYLNSNNFDYDAYIVNNMDHNMNGKQLFDIVRHSKYLNQ